MVRCPLTISLILKTPKNDNLFERLRRWHLPPQEWYYFSSFSFFRRRKMRERNQKRYFFFSLLRFFHGSVFCGRWRNEIFSFLFSSLKSLYLRAFLELWPCFFLISGREGKWCFFISCKASGYKKSLMPRGSAAQGFVVYYDIFSLLFPSYLRSRRSAGVSFWGSTGVGGDICNYSYSTVAGGLGVKS